MNRRRSAGFVGVCLLAVAIAVAALLTGARRAEEARQPTAATKLDKALDVAQVRSGPHIVFRSTAHGPTYGRLGVVPLSRPDGPRALLPQQCLRVYATATAGVCLDAKPGLLPGYRALFLDASLSTGREVPLIGIPSRARLSPDGTLAATTAFVEGHSYADGGFSTATVVYDSRSGRTFGNLEDFSVFRAGNRYRASDINVWGVTFVDRDRFYATVASGKATWLAEGSLSRRELRTLADGVECPSISPDGTKVVYKKRVSGEPVTWRLHVLDVASGRDAALAETRNVDDQAEWLDDRRVLYSLPRDSGDETDVWVVPADGSGRSRVLVPRAWSPAVIR